MIANKMTNEFKELLTHEGVVSIVSWANSDAHVVNTWNSYLLLEGDNKLYIPVYGMRKTEKNVDINNNVKLTFGSKEVMGYQSMGCGYRMEGTAKFITEGDVVNQMKEKFAWANRVLEVTVVELVQTI